MSVPQPNDASAAEAPPPLVSVVMPAYNEEELLHESVDSVLAQTYTHWDLTIVDNCSTDRTPEIAQAYARANPRIRVLRNATVLSRLANHNEAVRQISAGSKYGKVVAADDWIHPQCLERMVRIAERNPNVAIVSSYRAVGERLELDGLRDQRPVESGRNVCRDFLFGRNYLFGTPTSLLFRSDVLRAYDPFFPEPHLHADTLACLACLDGRDFGFVYEVLTCERVRDNSANAEARRYNLFLPGSLDCVVKFGPRYLSDSEMRTCIAHLLRAYYRYLAEQVGQGRGHAFWQLHRDLLAEIGYPLRNGRLLARVAARYFKSGFRQMSRALKPRGVS